VAASFLATLQRAGILTSVDVVSEESDRFRAIVPPALRYVDYLMVNEIEVGRVTGRAVRSPDGRLDGPQIQAAVDALYAFGNMRLVAVHMPEGVYVRERDGRRLALGSVCPPEGFIRSTLGAGDAFCAGMLCGLHQGWDSARAAELGICCATACLSHASATGGLLPVREALELGQRFPRRPPPVSV
jgi:sugar/nucleoside kinase (ribokinase family)